MVTELLCAVLLLTIFKSHDLPIVLDVSAVTIDVLNF